MTYTNDFDVYTFPFWGGAKETLDAVLKAGKGLELESWIENYFNGQTPSITLINDVVWFQRDTILEALGIDA